MSDPVTQAEIEDVLSSIRRLVSEDGRSLPRPAAAVQEVPKPVSRLVLTPALRVSEQPSETAGAAVPASSGGDSNAAVFAGSEQRDREAGQGDGLDPQGWDVQSHAPQEAESARPEAGSDISQGIAFELGDRGKNVAFRHKDSVDDPAPEPAPVPVSAPAAYDSHDALADAVAASPESALTSEATPDHREADDWEAEREAPGEAPTREAAPWRQPGATLYEAATPAEQQAIPAVGDAVAEASGDDAQIDEIRLEDMGTDAAFDSDSSSSQRVSAVVQKIAELEAKVARSQDQWEPDGASSDPYAGTNIETLTTIETLEWQDHIEDAPEPAQSPRLDSGLDAGATQAGSEAEAMRMDSGAETDIADAAQLAQDAVAEEALDALQGLTGDESYLDEDSLRELVADIVRSELQGALGERITRNVRKLVRREIHRALTAQDLL
jgi:cell pole-organizing protein PopZ